MEASTLVVEHPLDAEAIPTLTQWGRVFFIALLLLLGLAVLRRRRAGFGQPA